MPRKVFENKHIFGLKLKEHRQQKGITYQELSDLSGLSVSYLSEIESGKKYPKKDKIQLLAKALKVSNKEMISMDVPDKLKPVMELIESEFFRDFPLDDFGISPQKLIEIITKEPDKANAFINTVLRIANNYELTREKFYHTALRSFLESHNNYFEELEDAVEELHLEFTELKDIPFQPDILEDILLKIGVRVSYDRLKNYRALRDVRSIYHPTKRILYVNAGLTTGQKNLLLGREIAFQWLRMKIRSFTTPPKGNNTFEAILNGHKASYFAAALILPKYDLLEDIRKFAKNKKWNPEAFTDLLSKYDATPEMLMQRLTNLLPKFLNLSNLFFLRMLKSDGKYFLTKEIHLSLVHSPHTSELHEHYCRRWVATKVISELEQDKRRRPIARAQISSYENSPNSYFCLSIAFPNVSNPQESMSVTIGFLKEPNLRNHLSFVDDPDIYQAKVNVTCERCGLLNCRERAAFPRLLELQKVANKEENEIKKILS